MERNIAYGAPEVKLHHWATYNLLARAGPAKCIMKVQNAHNVEAVKPLSAYLMAAICFDMSC